MGWRRICPGSAGHVQLGHQVLDAARLHEIIESALPDRLDAGFEGGVSRQHDDRRRRRGFLDGAQGKSWPSITGMRISSTTASNGWASIKARAWRPSAGRHHVKVAVFEKAAHLIGKALLVVHQKYPPAGRGAFRQS